ncbi:hypothetical protein M0R45_018768 [Rubus argutus]|uniref:Uncharacterized protein n=1 Tax=Rubus argutus TaxID=59490 RepID=A0AAW1X5E1_RUBAR
MADLLCSANWVRNLGFQDWDFGVSDLAERSSWFSPKQCTSLNSSNVINQTEKNNNIWIKKDSLPPTSFKLPPNLKPILSTFSENEINQTGEKKYVRDEKDSLPAFPITEDIKDLNKNNTHPKLSTSSSQVPQSSFKSHSSSSKPSPSSLRLPPIFKPILSPASGKKNYVWVEKDSLPIFTIPEDIKGLIKNDIVPKVLNQAFVSHDI